MTGIYDAIPDSPSRNNFLKNKKAVLPKGKHGKLKLISLFCPQGLVSIRLQEIISIFQHVAWVIVDTEL